MSRGLRQALVEVRARGAAGAHVQSARDHALALPAVELGATCTTIYLQQNVYKSMSAKYK